MTVATNIYGMILIIPLRIEVKMGVKGYENLSWDRLSSIKKFGLKKVLGPVPGTCNFDQCENLSTSK